MPTEIDATRMPSTAVAMPGEAPAATIRPMSQVVSVFRDANEFEFGQRAATALSRSTIVPPLFQNSLPNCLALIEYSRMMPGVSPFVIAGELQNIHGRWGWSSKFIAAAINSCGLFSPLRFDWGGTPGADDWACRAKCIERATGDALTGPWVTIRMAKGEGWYNRTGSKWQTMPELMLTYRAIAFFGRIYAAHILSGMGSIEEVADTLAEPQPLRAVPDAPLAAAVADSAAAAAAAAADPMPRPAFDAPAGAAPPPEGSLSALNQQVRSRGRPRKTAAVAPAAAAGATAAPAPAAPAGGATVPAPLEELPPGQPGIVVGMDLRTPAPEPVPAAGPAALPGDEPFF